jgi:phage gp45-like
MKTLWAKVTGAGDNAKNWFIQQVTYKGKASNVIPVFPYGFFSHAKKEKSLGLIFFVNGKSENKAGIFFDPKNRPELLEGEVAIYQPDSKTIIKFLEDSSIEVFTESKLSVVASDVDVTANTVKITGNVSIEGNLSVTGTSKLQGTATLGTGGFSIAKHNDSVVNGKIVATSPNKTG